MHLFFSAGEPSGDQHAAQLMQHLWKHDPSLRLSGFGGPEMEKAGYDKQYQLTDLAVMGFVGVAPLLRKFWNLYKQAGRFFEEQRPDAVVLIDFPGFNWWIAKAAKRQGIPVYYYCPPQLWAWASWRIKKVHRYVDCVMSVLPFEAQWYRDRGVDVEYVGHPFFDEVAHHQLNQQAVQSLRSPGQITVGVLPGSRKQEVNRNFPIMLEMIDALSEKHPHARFEVACYKEWHHNRCAELLKEHGRPLPVQLSTGVTPEVIQAADFCMMVSGSVSLEMLARQTPSVVLYRAGLLTYTIASLLRNIDYISLPNLIAGYPIMPEFPFYRRKGPHVQQMINVMDRWLSDPAELAKSQNAVSELAEGVVEAGGVAGAAEVLLKRIGQATSLPMTKPESNKHAA